MGIDEGAVVDGKYRVERLLRRGGTSAVYLGENVRIGRRVAIKVLRTTGDEAGETFARFQREAKAAGRIDSDHVVQVLDFGVADDVEPYLVMEYLDGEPLDERLARGLLTPDEVIPIADQL